MFNYAPQYINIDLQPLIDAINATTQISCWDKAQTIATAASVVLSLVLSLVSWYRSSCKSWLKIENVRSSILYRDNVISINNSNPEGLYLTVNIKRKCEIPMKIQFAYVWLNKNFGFGYQVKDGENIFIGPIGFQLVRTSIFKKGQKMYEKMKVKDFYEERLKNRDCSDIKTGEIEIYTNTGKYTRKLSKEEVNSFKNTFSEVCYLIRDYVE